MTEEENGLKCNWEDCRGRTTQGPVDHAKGFSCYPGSNRKLLKVRGDEDQFIKISL